MATLSDQKLKDHLFVLILCGGGGKRLWPRSRKKTPKQFIDLFGNGTVFKQTVARAQKITSPEKVFIVTAYDYVDKVLTQGHNLLLRNIIAEPMAKNTALAMAMAAVYILRNDPQAVIINLTSDHVVSPDDVFVKDMLLAAKLAWQTNKIVTVGIKPNFPHTGFGYIRVGKEEVSLDNKEAFRVLNFTEKPNLSKAKKFLAAGNYFWNAGIYIWKGSVLLEAINQLDPQLSMVTNTIQKVIGKFNELDQIRKVYQEAEDVSIDYAISEKSDNLILLPATFNWDDIGDWEVVYQRSKKDKESNAIISYGQKGDYEVLEAQGNLIHFNNKLLALVGVNDLIVVDTDDALLICSRKEAEKVKQIVKKLESCGKTAYL